jgi:hypothetical protein
MLSQCIKTLLDLSAPDIHHFNNLNGLAIKQSFTDAGFKAIILFSF